MRSPVRFVLLGSLVLLAGAGLPPDERNASAVPSAQSGVPVRVNPEAAHAASGTSGLNPLEKPCDKGIDDRQSDLCAQWKAADAAAISAEWAGLSFYLALAGTGIGLLTLFAATAAAWYARRAADETRRSAEAAIAAVAIAKEGNELTAEERRPWLKFDVNVEASSAHGLMLRYVITNIGSYPASDIQTYCEIYKLPDSFDPHALVDDVVEQIERRLPNPVGSTVLPSETLRSARYVNFPDDEDYSVIVMVSAIAYRFGVRQMIYRSVQTHFVFETGLDGKSYDLTPFGLDQIV